MVIHGRLLELRDIARRTNRRFVVTFQFEEWYSEIASIQKSKALKHGYTITVELALENSVKARKLIVYSESGPVMGQLLTDETLKNRFFKIVVPWDSRDKYIRLEVRGSHRSSSMNQLFDRGAGSHLGSSNFVKIASVLIPQGD